MITERAMLAAVHISIWTAVKHDRKVSRDVANQHGAHESAGRYNKQLLRGAERLDALRTLAGQIRQHFYKITLPTMKAAVLVALLFRTLDAFRIFDTVFIQTKGANNTETVSILGYNQLINRVNLGVGSAVSVLLFVTVIFIAILFVKGFKADLGQVRGE